MAFACAEESETYTSMNYRYILLPDGTAEIVGYTGDDKELEIPSQLDGHTVTSIGDSAFFWHSSLIYVSIPDSVTSISDDAFSDCYSLTSVSIPDSVTSINEEAFSYCLSLASVSIPNCITSIGNAAFYS